jgi:protein-S-isoprenylcysteine O-methyltransferase Ste14
MDHPGVRVPPPLVYVAAILLGAGIDRFAPWPVLPAGLTRWLGGALVACAAIIAGLSVREFRKMRTAIRPDRPAAALVTTGPFRYVRNPMYLALSLAHVAIGIWINSAWIIGLVIPALAWVNYRVIPREERYLHGRFGQAYDDYHRRARRWL